MTPERARQWVAQTPCAGVADILCHRRLRQLDCAEGLVDEFLDPRQQQPMVRYTGLRLMHWLLPPERIERWRPVMMAEAQSSRSTATLAMMLLAEMADLMDEES